MDGATLEAPGAAGRPPQPFDAHGVAAEVDADMTRVFRTWMDGESGPATWSTRRGPFLGKAVANSGEARGRINVVAAAVSGALLGVSVSAVLIRPRLHSQAVAAHALHAHATPRRPRVAPASAKPAPLVRVPSVSAPQPWPHVVPAPAEPKPAVSPSASPLTYAAGGSRVAPPPHSLTAASRIGRARTAAPRAPSQNAPSPAPEMVPSGRSPHSGAEALAPPVQAAAVESSPLCYGLRSFDRYQCLVDASGAADVALRSSYEQAVAAGVPATTLKSDRQAWDALRPYGRSDPERMIMGYRSLSRTLRVQAATGRREPEEAYRPHSGRLGQDGSWR